MRTHELAKQLLEKPDAELFIDDMPTDELNLEVVHDTDGAVVILLWTKAEPASGTGVQP